MQTHFIFIFLAWALQIISPVCFADESNEFEPKDLYHEAGVYEGYDLEIEPFGNVPAEEVYLTLKNAEDLNYFNIAAGVNRLLKENPTTKKNFVDILERQARVANDLRGFAKMISALPAISSDLGLLWAAKYKGLRGRLAVTSFDEEKGYIFEQLAHVLFILSSSQLDLPDLYSWYSETLRHEFCYHSSYCLGLFTRVHRLDVDADMSLPHNQRVASDAILEVQYERSHSLPKQIISNDVSTTKHP